MAHSKYTGKSATSHITFDGASVLTGCRKITIAEKGRPAVASIDATVAADASYVFVDDPMGGKGTPSVVVTVEGFLNVLDFTESGITSVAVDTVAVLLVHKTAAGDLFTLTNAQYKGLTTAAKLSSGAVPYTATFEDTTTAGVWSTGA